MGFNSAFKGLNKEGQVYYKMIRLSRKPLHSCTIKPYFTSVMLHPKTDEPVNPSVEVHHLVGNLSTAETLLTEVQCKIPTYST